MATHILEHSIPEVDNVIVVHIAVRTNRELRSVTLMHYHNARPAPGDRASSVTVDLPGSSLAIKIMAN